MICPYNALTTQHASKSGKCETCVCVISRNKDKAKENPHEMSSYRVENSSRNAISCTAFTPITLFSIFFFFFFFSLVHFCNGSTSIDPGTERRRQWNCNHIKWCARCQGKRARSFDTVFSRIVAQPFPFILLPLDGLLFIKYKLIITCAGFFFVFFFCFIFLLFWLQPRLHSFISFS